MIIGKIGETFCVIHGGGKAVFMINGGFIDGSGRAVANAAAAQLAVIQYPGMLISFVNG